MNPSSHIIEWEYQDITPERVLLRLYNTLIKNWVHHIRIQQFAKLIDQKKERITAEDINSMKVQGLSLITLLYQYGYQNEAEMFFKIEGVEKNKLDIYVWKLLFVFWVWNDTINSYIKDFQINGDINAIPNLWITPSWSILHFLVTLYINNKYYTKYEILWLIEELFNIKGFNVNSLDTVWYTVLDSLFFEPRDTTWKIEQLEDYLRESWATYFSTNWEKINKYLKKYSQTTMWIIDNWFKTSI